MFGFHPELAPIRFGVCKKIKGHGWKPAYIMMYLYSHEEKKLCNVQQRSTLIQVIYYFPFSFLLYFISIIRL